MAKDAHNSTRRRAGKNLGIPAKMLSIRVGILSIDDGGKLGKEGKSVTE
jgi:hypothetical protein